jgi:hypothetical protein
MFNTAKIMCGKPLGLGIGALLALLAAAFPAQAADDEIQVYTNDINKPGELGLEVHMNYVPVGSAERQWPEQVPPRQMFRTTAEFSYGLSEKVELGFYIPVIKGVGEPVQIEGAKARLKYLDAPEERAFYWGVNFELGRMSLRTVEQHWNAEIRPIIGYRDGGWNFTVNPRLGFGLSEGASHVPDFNPCYRIVREVAKNWAVGVEHYSEYGPVNRFLPSSERSQNTYLVMDGRAGSMDFNVGVGKGWTDASDRLVFKAILGFAF